MGLLNKTKSKTIWVYDFSLGPCNIPLEIWAPRYDDLRETIKVTDSPRHADCMIFTGVITDENHQRFVNQFLKLPKPRKILAVGNCTIGANRLIKSHHIRSIIDNVDKETKISHLSGCPPEITKILESLKKLNDINEE